MKTTIFDSEKALAALLYVAASIPEEQNTYKVLKAIYRANKTHLGRYGRELFHERYQALEWGAVPQLPYDIVTHVRDGRPQNHMPHDVKNKVSVSKTHTIKPLVAPPTDLLSKSDIECLGEAIDFYRGKDFGWVASNAHEDQAYIKTYAKKPNGDIPLSDILDLTVENGKLLLEQFKAA